MDFANLRNVLSTMADKLCNLVTKKETGYVENQTRYKRNGAILNDATKSYLSASDGKYYEVDKVKQSERTAQQNLERMAVALANTDARFIKKAFASLDQISKLIELVGGNQPCDPAWVEKYLRDLAQLATSLKNAGERNEQRFANWSPEPDQTSTATDRTAKVWSPV
jgi:hypothetical protein